MVFLPERKSRSQHQSLKMGKLRQIDHHVIVGKKEENDFSLSFSHFFRLNPWIMPRITSGSSKALENLFVWCGHDAWLCSGT